ncbi:UNVERIFIED_CONTAM: hypothetical protein FKN15_009424 [Acipenser sinensis]
MFQRPQSPETDTMDCLTGQISAASSATFCIKEYVTEHVLQMKSSFHSLTTTYISQEWTGLINTTPLLCSLHWLPITAHIQFKTIVLAYRYLDQTAPSYLQALISPYTPTRPLRSSCTRRLAVPPLRSPASRARSFSTLAPLWWNDLPTDVRTAQSLTTFRRLLKTHLFRQHL